MNQDLTNFFQQTNINFDIYIKNKEMFEEAFVHRSFTKDKKIQHNERLEFLGDAVLELITTEFLYTKFPKDTEGNLTSYRSALVRKENLAKVAKKINLGDFLKLSKGEEKSGGREKDYLLANLIEAFIGALYLSSGLNDTQKFVTEFVLSELDEILAEESYIDPKSAFQEFTQGSLGLTPSYKVLAESGKDHQKQFIMGVFLDGKKISEGTGGSKKESQTNAAEKAIETKDLWSHNFDKK